MLRDLLTHMISFIHSTHWLGIYYVSETALVAEGTAVNKTDKIPCLSTANILVRLGR